MDSHCRPIGPPASHVVATDVDGHVGLYNPVTVRVHVLNRTASDTWLLSDGQHTADEIVELLALAYDVSPDEIRPTVLDTIETFLNHELLCRPDGSP